MGKRRQVNISQKSNRIGGARLGARRPPKLDFQAIVDTLEKHSIDALIIIGMIARFG